MYNILIYIKKNRRTMGSIFFKSIQSIEKGFEESKKIIDNYNSNLVNLKVPEEILAMKMLQKQNIKGNLPTGLPILMDSTYVFLDNVHGNDYKIISGINEKYGFIGMTNKDVDAYLEDSDYTIVINFDNNMISTDIDFIDDYKTISKVQFLFNELEDYIEEVKELIPS